MASKKTATRHLNTVEKVNSDCSSDDEVTGVLGRKKYWKPEGIDLDYQVVKSNHKIFDEFEEALYAGDSVPRLSVYRLKPWEKRPSITRKRERALAEGRPFVMPDKENRPQRHQVQKVAISKNCTEVEQQLKQSGVWETDGPYLLFYRVKYGLLLGDRLKGLFIHHINDDHANLSDEHITNLIPVPEDNSLHLMAHHRMNDGKPFPDKFLELMEERNEKMKAILRANASQGKVIQTKTSAVTLTHERVEALIREWLPTRFAPLEQLFPSNFNHPDFRELPPRYEGGSPVRLLRAQEGTLTIEDMESIVDDFWEASRAC